MVSLKVHHLLQKKSFEEIFDNNTSLQSDVLSFDTIHDEDWKNSYKKHFKPWNIDTFHWVPIWDESTYIIPNNHKGFFLIQEWHLELVITKLQNYAFNQL